MTSRPWSLVVVFAFAFALLPLASAATGDIALPTWPQKFSVARGQTHYYGFPVDKAGKIVVDLAWTGPAMNVSLLDVNGKALATAPNEAAPRAHLTFTLTAEQVAAGLIYSISLEVPAPKTPPQPVFPKLSPTTPPKLLPAVKPPPIPTAVGKITVTAPAVDVATLQPKLHALVTTQQASLASERSRLAALPKPQPFSARLSALNAERSTKLASLHEALLAQFNTKSSALTASLHTASTSVLRLGTKTSRLGNVKFTGKIGPHTMITPPSNKYTTPTIVGGTPDMTGLAGHTSGGGAGGGAASGAVTGYPGDKITLQVGGIDPDAANIAIFTIHTTVNGSPSTLNSPGIVYGATADPNSGDVVDLIVGVPAAGDTADPKASVIVKDPAGNASDPFPFAYNPIPAPVITGVRAPDGLAVSGHSLLLDGSGFTTGCKVFFKQIPGSAGSVAAGASSAATPTDKLLPAGIPTYTAATEFVAAVYVAYHYKHNDFEGDVYSPDFPVTLEATSIAFTGADRTSAEPQSSVLLNGTGFGSTRGEVHCVFAYLDPQFQVQSRDLVASIGNWSDTSLLFTVPDYDGLPRDAVGTIQVKRPDGLTSTIPFTFSPQIVHQLMDLSKWAVGSYWYMATDHGPDTYELQDNGTKLHVSHDSDNWHNSSGVDALFAITDLWPIVPGMQFLARYLQNGWTVSAINYNWDQNSWWYQYHCSGHAGSNDPAVRVEWFVRAAILDTAYPQDYFLSIDLVGPKGVPYFNDPPQINYYP